MNFKWVTKVAIITLVISMMIVSPVLAAKPDGSNGSKDVIAKSNGFPSGMHFNLNIHGRDLSLDTPCTHEAGGNSVFIELYGDSTIQYQSDKKGNATELTVTDPCASDDGLVSIKIPAKVNVTDDLTGVTETVAVAGYTVYGRILGTPQNGKNDPENRSNILFSPNRVTEVSNTEVIDGQLVSLGLITWADIYYDGVDAYYRFEDPSAKGRGKSKARSMTKLFMYTGWVVDESLDTNSELDDGVPDGKITIEDVPLGNYDVLSYPDPDGSLTPDNRDFNNDGEENDLDVADWLTTQGDLAIEYENEWIFNIADVVTTEGDVTNDGTKLFKIRFYPYFE
jgi:hypothetical protein